MKRTAHRDVPIVPFRTFVTSLDELANGGPVLPRRLDRSLFDTFSGAVYKLVANSYRLLDLIDDDRSLNQARLQALLDRKTRGAALRQLLRERYRDILDAAPSAATESQLNEWFARAGLDEVSQRKARAFFLQACAAADIPLPKPQRVALSPKKKKHIRTTPRSDRPESVDLPAPILQWLHQLPKPDQRWSADDLDSWLAAFASMLRHLYLTSKP